MRRYLLALSIALAVLLAPSLAFADDGFVGGLQDLVGVREVEQSTVTPEQDFTDEYEPAYTPLRSGDEVAIEEGSEIQSVVNAANTVPWGSTLRIDLVGSILRLFTLSFGDAAGWARIPTVAAGLVFMWWGVRKALKMIMSAFRKGRASV